MWHFFYRNFRAQGVVYVSLQGKETSYKMCSLELTFYSSLIISCCCHCEPPLTHSCPSIQLSMCRCAILILISLTHEFRQGSPVAVCWDERPRKQKHGVGGRRQEHRKGCVSSQGPISRWGSSSETCGKYTECFLEVSIRRMALPTASSPSLLFLWKLNVFWLKASSLQEKPLIGIWKSWLLLDIGLCLRMSQC